jgi:hypothetical protein
VMVEKGSELLGLSDPLAVGHPLPSPILFEPILKVTRSVSCCVSAVEEGLNR